MTSGEWEVRGPGGGPFQSRAVHHVDEKGGWVYFTGTKDSPTATNLYRVRLDGTRPRTADAGRRRALASSLNPTGDLFVDTCSDPTTPTKVRLLRDRRRRVVRTLDTNPVYLREEYRLGHVRTGADPDARTASTSEAAILKPPDFDPAKKYPVWFQTYAGPHAPTVDDSWGGGRVSDQVLASMGFIVFRCDPRSASGKGACSAWTAYRSSACRSEGPGRGDRLAVPEPVGRPEAGRHERPQLRRLHDRLRLTHRKMFAAGIASAPVTDWRNYDSIYTERYMNTPQENPDGLRRHVGGRRRRRTCTAGCCSSTALMDDNVHLQNTLQLVDALQRADKDFEMMVYPRARHGGFGRHNQRQFYEFVRRTVLDREIRFADVPEKGSRRRRT